MVETLGQMAKKLGTDSRNILLHMKTSEELGVPVDEWINYLKACPPLDEVAERFYVSKNTVARWFDRWLKIYGKKKRWYMYFNRRKIMRGGRQIVVSIREIHAPKDFLKWAEHYSKLGRMKTLAQVSKELGLSQSLIIDEFMQWCHDKGIKPELYRYNTFHAPPEFINFLKHKYPFVMLRR